MTYRAGGLGILRRRGRLKEGVPELRALATDGEERDGEEQGESS